ncbi:TPA: phage virion morphogenesis protein [Enterobacter ludwigii]|uniref:phage virion morphogenesis protein n=1 Tax=Enterobacter TaxID=547 RepID=UPI002016ABB5|nr:MULTISPECIES: phage virion morphogenesis protein [Enterobacter]WGG67513.1 phage virion morphogenesis protein [Enterobacter ludwigii]
MQRIASIHQLGLKDRPNPKSRDVQYPKRVLFGLNSDNEGLIKDIILQSFQKRS